MKKLKFLVTMALLFLSAGVYADSKVTVSAGNFTPGSTCAVTVSLETTTTVAAYQMALYLPEGFSINRYYDEDEEEEVYDYTLSTRHKTGHSLGITTQTDGGLLILVYANPTKTLKSSPNELFTVRLKAASTAITSAQASFKNVKITDANGVDTNLDDVSFNLTVKPVSVLDNGNGGYDVIVNENCGGGADADVIPDNVLTGGSINVATLTYTRELEAPSGGSAGDATIDGKAAYLYTVCLPDVPATAANAKYYTLDAASNTTLSFAEVANSSLAANTPYLVAVTEGSNLDESLTASNVPLKKEADNSTEKDGFIFKGTLTGLTNADAAAAGAYILQGNNSWGKVTTANANAYVPAFRAYIVSTGSGAPTLLSGNVGDGNMTGVQTIRTVDQDGTERWYDLNGRRIAKPANKGVYIINGRKGVVK